MTNNNIAVQAALDALRALNALVDLEALPLWERVEEAPSQAAFEALGALDEAIREAYYQTSTKDVNDAGRALWRAYEIAGEADGIPRLRQSIKALI